MVKSLEFFIATTSASEVKFVSCWSNLILSRLHVMEKALFLRLFKVSVDRLIYDLESGKSLEFWIKNLKIWKKPISLSK